MTEPTQPPVYQAEAHSGDGVGNDPPFFAQTEIYCESLPSSPENDQAWLDFVQGICDRGNSTFDRAWKYDVYGHLTYLLNPPE